MANEPTKPTSGTWAGDASALLAMGAKAIDSATVRGLIGELQQAIELVAENEGAFKVWRRRCTEAEAKLAVARAALRFYANDLDNITGDFLGERAREALKAIGEE